MKRQNGEHPKGSVMSGQQRNKLTEGDNMHKLKVRILVSVLVAAMVPTFVIGKDLAKPANGVESKQAQAKMSAPEKSKDADFEFKQAQTLKSARERAKEARERLDAFIKGQPVPEPSGVANVKPAAPMLALSA